MQCAQDVAKFKHVPRQHAIPAARRDGRCCIVVNEKSLQMQPYGSAPQLADTQHWVLQATWSKCHSFTASTLLRD